MLQTVGAQKTIDKLFLVTTTFLNFIQKRKDTKELQWLPIDGQLHHAFKASQIIYSNRGQIKVHLDRLDLRPDQDRNNYFRTIIGLGPLYATIGYLPKNLDHLDNFYSLLFHVLAANLEMTRKDVAIEKEDYEKALKDIRTLCKSPLLALFPTEIQPLDLYVEKLSGLRENPGCKALLNFLSDALKLIRPISLKELELKIQQSSKSTITDSIFHTPEPLDLAQVFMETRPVETIHDDDPSLPEVGNIFAFSKELLSEKSEEDFFNSAQMIQKSRSMENQNFHFAWDNLNSFDLQVLVAYLFQNTDVNHADLTKRIQLGLMLFAGLTSEEISALEFVQSANLATGDAYIESNNTLYLETPGPIFKTQLPKEALEQAYPKETKSELSLPPQLVALIETHITQRKLDSGCRLLFKQNPDQVFNDCKKVLLSLKRRKGAKLTLTRVQKHIEKRISRLIDSDLSAASLALGKDIYLARTRIHYAGSDPDILLRIHALACVAIQNETGSDIRFEEPYPASAPSVIGTPIRPKLITVQTLIAEIKNFLEETEDKLNTWSGVIDYHNAFTLYTILFIAYCTGYRANNTPFISEDMYDSVTGFCVIADKTSRDQYHSRLVWLTKCCRQHLDLYQKHLSIILSLSEKPLKRSSSPDTKLFFLNQKGQRQTATRTIIISHLKKFGFYLPPNVQRHFIKSELQENKCSSEVIEILLGHWHIGEEPWVESSALHPWDYKNELEKHLPPLLKLIGLIPLKGFSKKPRISPLPLREQTRNERKPLPKNLANRRMEKYSKILENNEPHKTWFKILGKSLQSIKASKAFKKEEHIVLVKMLSIYPELYFGKLGSTLDESKLQALIERLKPRPMYPRLWYKRMNFLIDGLAYGKENHNWQLELPQRPVIIAKPFNLARPSLIRQLKTFRRFEEVFKKDLEEPYPKQSQIQVGQLLFSAMLYGGINHPTWAKAYLEGLLNLIFQYDHFLWVDLWAEPKEDVSDYEIWMRQRNSSIYRRWISDHTTQSLIYRWLKQGKSTKRHDLDTTLEDYTKHLAAKHKVKLPPMEDIWGAVRAYSTLHMPPFLAMYAANRISSSSLPDPVWIREISEHCVPFSSRPTIRRSSLINSYSPADMRQQKKWFDELRKLIKENEKTPSKELAKYIENFLNKKSGYICQASELLGRWAIQLLSRRKYIRENRQKEALIPKSVYKYIGAFGEAFLTVSQKVNISNLDDENNDIAYLFKSTVTVIQESRKKENQKSKDSPQESIDWIVKRLEQFLLYLELFEGFPAIELELKDDQILVRPGKEVRANLISHKTYRRLLEYLGWGKPILSRSQKMTIVAAILVYRFGLRMSEIFGLLVSDFVGDTFCEILVQPNHIRRLKSSAATRRALLYLLAYLEELQFVFDFVHFRKNELGTDKKSPLFTSAPMETEPVPISHLFDPIKVGLVDLTGDTTLVPYSLRHSFLNNLLLRLLIRRPLPAKLAPNFMQHSDFDIRACQKLRTSLLKNETLGRKVLYAGANIMGHADTKTELTSYFHLCDLLLWQNALDPHIGPPLSAKAIKEITGMSIPNAHKRLQKDIHPLTVHVRKTSRDFAEELAHPLTKIEKTPTALETDHTSPAAHSDFDVALVRFLRNPLPPGLTSPRTWIEVRALSYLYQNLSTIEADEWNSIEKGLSTLTEGFKHYDGTFVLESTNDADNAIQVLNHAGIKTSGLVGEHLPSRWVPNSKEERVLKNWENALGLKIIPHNKTAGKNLPGGVIRLSVKEIHVLGHCVVFDKSVANLLAISMHMLKQPSFTSKH